MFYPFYTDGADEALGDHKEYIGRDVAPDMTEEACDEIENMEAFRPKIVQTTDSELVYYSSIVNGKS